MKKCPFKLLLCFCLLGCANIRSGKYHTMRSGETLDSLAKRYRIKRTRLLQANRTKSFRKGEWIFIPKRLGFWNEVFESHENSRGSYEEVLYRGKLLWPVPASTRISSFYGRRGRGHHDGIDIPAPRGTHVLAAEDGVVKFSGRGPTGYGKLTIVTHKGGLSTVYAHASKNLTRKGQKVYRGQVIAKVGSTGRSTGNHLHFEVRHGKRALNPIRYVKMSREVLTARNNSP